ncbi:hypothetical protein PHYPSEUDO_010380 [Phytophthora pseudosyringae]|uniref:Uncharacterized protein n=1 Tax=Phytophthora pseudosyringae TaxID=221518 RepID=A0A8T1W817_9STRA|nr:hypothetical protein PHYPSEUDO_010380 [Phytophthora pseudosyringae]
MLAVCGASMNSQTSIRPLVGSSKLIVSGIRKVTVDTIVCTIHPMYSSCSTHLLLRKRGGEPVFIGELPPRVKNPAICKPYQEVNVGVGMIFTTTPFNASH